MHVGLYSCPQSKFVRSYSVIYNINVNSLYAQYNTLLDCVDRNVILNFACHTTNKVKYP